MIQDSAEWNIPVLNSIFDPHTVNAITIIHINGTGKDSPKWNPNISGAFNTKSLYYSIKRFDHNWPSIWENIWSMHASPRVKLFAFKCLQNMIPINSRLVQFMDISNSCSVFSQHNESLEHIFFSFPFARSVWFASDSNPFPPNLFTFSVKVWILHWHTNPAGWDSSQGQWSAKCATIIWYIWKARCDKVFRGFNPSSKDVCTRAEMDWKAHASLECPLDNASSVNAHKPEPTWKSPPPRIKKINFAGTFDNHRQVGSIALILINSISWCREVKKLECRAQSLDEVEVQAALEATTWSYQLDTTVVQIEGSCINIIKAINGEDYHIDWKARSRIRDIHEKLVTCSLNVEEKNLIFLCCGKRQTRLLLHWLQGSIQMQPVILLPPPSLLFDALNSDRLSCHVPQGTQTSQLL
ncbi:uncharacterized protein LOC113359547 [Papaver somniferum]|uniref:uncharacterized protein LOC113359547 n=1 Tax=Papaver somniferum TaxID=3469 RepID=UPI000E702B33|nr:uncharacterized protein LOC113359547 [Papaver somniferum]